jgi:glycosyltransferase involved in cell wall biosynthesis
MLLAADLMLDCDLMRYRDSGLYHYCLNLGKALRPLAAEAGFEMGFYVPPSERTTFGEGVPVYRERSGWRRWWPNHFMRRCRLWHAPFQSGRVVPDRLRNPGCRVLLTVHDLNVLHEGKPAEEVRRSLAHTRSLIERADAVVCISEFCRQDVLTHTGPVNKPVYVIHNGTHAVGEPRLEAGSYRPQRPFLFGLGYVNRKKNYQVLLPLLKNPDWELVIAGRLDEPDYVEAMRQEAIQLRVEDRLHLTGPVSEGE